MTARPRPLALGAGAAARRPRPHRLRRQRPGRLGRAARPTVTVDGNARRVHRLDDQRAERPGHVHHDEHGHRQRPSSSCSPRTASASSARRRTSVPGTTRSLTVAVPARRLLHRVHPRPRRRGRPRAVHRDRSGTTVEPTGSDASSRSTPPPPPTSATSRTRSGSSCPPPRSSSTPTRGRRRPGPRALPDDPRVLRAHRARRRVVRRPRPEDRLPRGGRRGGRRSGPAGTASRRTSGSRRGRRRTARRLRRRSTADERARFADAAHERHRELHDAVHADDFTVSIDTISNGAVGLIDEVATGKITGEEEIWSHTDLWDFQANLEGARVAYEGVRDIVVDEGPASSSTSSTRASRSLEQLLAAYGSLDAGFPSYTELTDATRRSSSDAVNALSEPLASSPRRSSADDDHVDRRPTARLQPTTPQRPRALPPRAARPARHRRAARACSAPASGSVADRAVAGARDRHLRRGAPRTRSPARTSRASPPPPRTACTSPRSTSRRAPPRDDLVELLQDWSAAAARLTRRPRRQRGRRRRRLDARAARRHRRGARPARRRPHHHDRLRPDALHGRRRHRPLRPRRPPARRARRPAALPRRPARRRRRRGGDLCIQACSDDPQVAVHAIRNLSRIAFGRASLRWSQLGFGRTSSTTPRPGRRRATSSASRTAPRTSAPRTPPPSSRASGPPPATAPAGWTAARTSSPARSA